MNRISQTRRRVVGATAFFPFVAARAQSGFPSRPIRIIVPFPVGGGSDLATRPLTSSMQEALGQPVIVENVPGAAGTIGIERALRAQPDGYTLVVGNASPMAILAARLDAASPNGGDFVRAATPIGHLVSATNLVIARTDLQAKTVPELFALSNKGNVTFGMLGSGTAGDVLVEFGRQRHGAALTAVPYRGAAPMIVDMTGGSLDAGLADIGAAQAHVRSGRIKVLAATAARRATLFPDVPTLEEQGVRFTNTTWAAVFAPAGTPAAVADRIAAAFSAAKAGKPFVDTMTTLGMETTATYRDPWGKTARTDIDAWTALLRETGLLAKLISAT